MQLEKCVEYTGSGQSKIILRGDTVEVRYLRLGVSALARVTKTDYNVLLDRYDSIQVGNVKEKLARTTVRERSRVTTTNDRAVDASRVATNYIAEKQTETSISASAITRTSSTGMGWSSEASRIKTK